MRNAHERAMVYELNPNGGWGEYQEMSLGQALALLGAEAAVTGGDIEITHNRSGMVVRKPYMRWDGSAHHSQVSFYLGFEK